MPRKRTIIDPSNPRRVHRNPGGRTDAQMKAAIARAIRRINDLKREHGTLLAEEIGEYLLVEVYDDDVEYLTMRDPGRTNSLRDIAEGVPLTHTTLDKYINVALYRRITGTEDIDICMSAMAQAGRLADRVDAALAIARWTERDHVTVERLQRTVTYWIDQLKHENRPLIELVRQPEPPGPRPEPKPRRPRLKPRELCVVDVLTVMREMLERRDLPERSRQAALARVKEIRRMLLALGRGR